VNKFITIWFTKTKKIGMNFELSNMRDSSLFRFCQVSASVSNSRVSKVIKSALSYRFQSSGEELYSSICEENLAQSRPGLVNIVKDSIEYFIQSFPTQM